MTETATMPPPVAAETVAEMARLLRYFWEPRKTYCSCSDGPLCEICRCRRVLDEVNKTTQG